MVSSLRFVMKLDLAQRLMQCMFFAASVCATVPTAFGQPQPVTFVVSAAPAGALDIQARALAAAMRSESGLDVSVQNVAGGAGLLAAERVANSTGAPLSLLFHNGYFQGGLTARLQPVALVSETVLGVWRHGQNPSNQPNIALGGSLASAVFSYANGAVFSQNGGAPPVIIPYRNVLSAVEGASQNGDYFLAELSNHDVATQKGMVLVATSSPALAAQLGFRPAGGAFAGLQELVIPVGLYAPAQGVVPIELLDAIVKAIESPTFKSQSFGRQYLPLGRRPNHLIERVNEFAALAEISAANGGAVFVGKPERMSASVASTLPASQKTNGAIDAPKTVGLGARGG